MSIQLTPVSGNRFVASFIGYNGAQKSAVLNSTDLPSAVSEAAERANRYWAAVEEKFGHPVEMPKCPDPLEGAPEWSLDEWIKLCDRLDELGKKEREASEYRARSTYRPTKNKRRVSRL